MVSAVAESLVLHGRFIRSHLEGAGPRQPLLSPTSSACSRWLRCSAGSEGREWGGWVPGAGGGAGPPGRADGCDHEASIPYHRLVDRAVRLRPAAAEVLAPERAEAHRERSGGCSSSRATTRARTRSPRRSATPTTAASCRSATTAPIRVLISTCSGRPATRGRRSVCAAYRDAGLYVQRRGDAYLLVRCGTTGVGGQGWHAHNDQLSFELALGALPLVVDPRHVSVHRRSWREESLPVDSISRDRRGRWCRAKRSIAG